MIATKTASAVRLEPATEFLLRSISGDSCSGTCRGVEGAVAKRGNGYAQSDDSWAFIFFRRIKSTFSRCKFGLVQEGSKSVQTIRKALGLYSDS